jgi:hypothetical protein
MALVQGKYDGGYGEPRECAFCGTKIAVTDVDPSVMGIEPSGNDRQMSFWFCHAACFKRQLVGSIPRDDIPIRDHAKPTHRRYGPSGELQAMQVLRQGHQGYRLESRQTWYLDDRWELRPLALPCPVLQRAARGCYSARPDVVRCSEDAPSLSANRGGGILPIGREIEVATNRPVTRASIDTGASATGRDGKFRDGRSDP